MNLKPSMLRACVVLALACGAPKYDQQQTQVPITPTGSLVGRVTDLSTGAPIEGVTVSAVGPTVLTGTTDATGYYVINELVVGSEFNVIFEKSGYLRGNSWAEVPSYAGNAPLTGGFTSLNQSMAKPDGEIRGTLLLPNGSPAVGAVVTTDLRNNSFDLVVSATTDSAGNFKLVGLPSAPYGFYSEVYAQAFDQNADGIADFGSTNDWVQVFPGTPARMILYYNDLGQTILSNNIADQELGASENIELTFSLPVVIGGHSGGSADQFMLYNTTRDYAIIGLEVTWASANKVSLKPAGGPLTEGDRYQLYLNNLEAVGTPNQNLSRSFDFQVRGANVVGPSGAVTNLTVTSSLTDPNTFNYNTSNFTAAFDPVPGIVNYWIYAKDTGFNPAFSRVSTVSINPSSPMGRVTRNFTLPNSFNNSQPVSNGVKLTIVVVPVDTYGNAGALATAPAVTVQDNLSPTTGSVSAVGAVDAINDTTAEISIVLRVSYSEPMDTTTPPVLTSTAGAITQSFVWEINNNAGLLTLKVPMKTDLSGSFTIRGGKDLAGNTISGPEFTGFLGGRKELLVNGGFEDSAGACTLTGWTAVSAGGMPMINAVAGAGVPAVGRCAALLGAPLGGAPAVGTASLSQDIVLPDLTNTPSWRFEVRHSERPEYFSPTGQSATVLQRCRVTDTSDVFIQNVFTFNSATQATYSGPFLTAFTPVTAGQTVRLMCQVDNSVALAPAVNGALYLDDLSFAVVKNTLFNN